MKYNKLIDSTLLRADATQQEIIDLCQEAKKYNFASCCVNGDYVGLVHRQLEGSDVKTCTVVGFPLGAMSTIAKIEEAKESIFEGADEIDMVINISWLKDKKYDDILYELKRMRRTCYTEQHPIILKVIIECCLLTKEEKIKACELCKEAGVDFVKTSTGFSKYGATVEDVKLLHEVCGDFPKIKASGGIKTKEFMEELIQAGASRIGTSNGPKLVE